ncbi:hypothetical protein [Bacillus sp. UNC438CL73TsuS30]|uniref:hypothetical protein n=1 Tax=Bacillus sp. UNC438CL73TsuS30 TaxID=1340434 RepID=UPI0005565644|nr:hypothetical protein [Bacillus sp. UNC438CL73TsuS30]
MPQDVLLSKRFLNDVTSKLSEKGFSIEDFDIDQNSDPKSYNVIHLKIRYNYDKQYYFNSEINTNSNKINIRYSPGEITSYTQERDCTIDEFLEAIDNWINLLRDELKSTVLGRQVYDNKEKIHEIHNLIREKFSNDEESYFSREEGEELKNKITELENLFKENIEKQEENKTKLKSEIDKLQEEAELLKEQVTFLSKRKWITALMIKMMNWSSRNPEAAKQIGQAAVKAVLPKEIEQSLPPSLLPPSDI